MAVLKRKRSIAYIEFERQMGKICIEAKLRTATVPARYKKYLNRKIYEPTSRAYEATILANEKNARVEKEKNERDGLLHAAIYQLLRLQKPLLAYWNLKDTTEGGMKQLANLVNREFALLHGVLGIKDEPPMMITLPKRKAKELLFLGNMCALHKFCYQKIGHAPNDCTDFVSAHIADFADSALYHVVMANRKAPENREEAEERENHIRHAIDCLNGMQRPILSLWNLMDYSERTMDEWAGMIDEEIRLLEGLKKADKTRFKNLT